MTIGYSIYFLDNFIHLGNTVPGLSVRWLVRLSSFAKGIDPVRLSVVPLGDVEGEEGEELSGSDASGSAPGAGRSSIIITYFPLRKGEF